MQPLIYKFYSPAGLKKSRNISNSSRLAIIEAEKLGIGWEIIPGTQIVTLTYHGQKKSYHHQIPSSTTAIAKYACNNKKITSNLLHQAGISVPRGFRIRRNYDDAYVTTVFESLKKPLVVKPSNGTWGDNIVVSINTPQEYLAALQLALAYSSDKNTGAIVEEMFEGEEYRILATREKVIGVLKRIPANVKGDGTSTIEQLIKEKNKQEIRGEKNGKKSHAKIRVDKKLTDFLTAQKLTLNSIPPQKKIIYLRNVSNISQGGDAIDYTDIVHPSVKEIALKAIQTIPGLSFAGIDFMSVDITKPQTKDDYVIIEINDSPGFDIHDYPYQGKNRHAAREFLQLMFPTLTE